MIAVLLSLLGCPADGGGACTSQYGPESVSVKFAVADEGDYAWSIVGAEDQMNCTAIVTGGGFIECDLGTYGMIEPTEAEGGGWMFGTSLSTAADDASVHVTLSSGSETLLDTDFAPEWTPSDTGKCVDHLHASQEFDLRDDSGDTGA